MKIQTKWFGEIDTTEDKIITFEKGIIGFEDFSQQKNLRLHFLLSNRKL